MNPFKRGGDDATHLTHQVEQVVSSASSNPFQIPIGHITRALAKRFKEGLNVLIQDIWVQHPVNPQSKVQHPEKLKSDLGDPVEPLNTKKQEPKVLRTPHG